MRDRIWTPYCHMQGDEELFSHSIPAPDAVFVKSLLLKYQCRERTCASMWAGLPLALRRVPALCSRRLPELFHSNQTSSLFCASVAASDKLCLRILLWTPDNNSQILGSSSIVCPSWGRSMLTRLPQHPDPASSHACLLFFPGTLLNP